MMIQVQGKTFATPGFHSRRACLRPPVLCSRGTALLGQRYRTPNTAWIRISTSVPGESFGRTQLTTRAGIFDRFSSADTESQPAEGCPSLEPPFTTFKQQKNYDVRLYDSYAVAETYYDKRPEGIAVLAAYMDGENELGVKLPATQPILMSYVPSDQGLVKTMRLYLNTGAAGGSPPLPKDSSVRIDIGGAELVAVLTFSGNITPTVAEDARARLMDALCKDGIDPDSDVVDARGSFRIAQYGPLYSLRSRRNEFWLRLTPAGAAKIS